VIVAAIGVQRALLQEEFASLTFVDLPGYRIKYGKNRAITILLLICSIPKILIRVKREKAWLARFTADEGLDLVISDNRYGLAVPGVFSVFITHQLLIKTPFGRTADLLLQRMSYRFIRRFSRCWVPDIQGVDALAGELSNPQRLPSIPTRYIGWLSRMGTGAAATEGTDLLVLLSGPEPQRTLLEDCILRQAGGVSSRITLVRGLPGGGKALKEAPSSMTVYDHLPARKLEALIRSAGLVLARSGYSTVMDLMRLKKKAIFVPTPGQTEQEYLANYLAERGWAFSIRQKGLSLPLALDAARAFCYCPAPEPESEGLADAIRDAARQSTT
jgi:UDP-N-acetylglucosamine transferase subunit ALG13